MLHFIHVRFHLLAKQANGAKAFACKSMHANACEACISMLRHVDTRFHTACMYLHALACKCMSSMNDTACNQ